jgi:hypothetical protein
VLLAFSTAGITPAQAAEFTVPQGTQMRLILQNSLSTRTAQEHDQFTATLAQSVRVGDRVIFPAGSVVQGEVTLVERAKRLAPFRGKAAIHLRFETVRTPAGRDYPLMASLVSVHEPGKDIEQSSAKAKTSEEGTVEAKSDVKKDILTGLGAAGGGALVGAIFGSVARGLVIGTAGGAAYVLAKKGKEVDLPQGTGMVIRMDRALTIPD